MCSASYHTITNSPLPEPPPTLLCLRAALLVPSNRKQPTTSQLLLLNCFSSTALELSLFISSLLLVLKKFLSKSLSKQFHKRFSSRRRCKLPSRHLLLFSLTRPSQVYRKRTDLASASSISSVNQRYLLRATLIGPSRHSAYSGAADCGISPRLNTHPLFPVLPLILLGCP